MSDQKQEDVSRGFFRTRARFIIGVSLVSIVAATALVFTIHTFFMQELRALNTTIAFVVSFLIAIPVNTYMTNIHFTLKRVKNEMAAAKAEAERANQSKSAFLANMSHEIRTPLNGVLGMAQALAAEELSDEQRDKVDTMLDSSGTLMTVVNDILDLSKIEAGKLEILPIDADLKAHLSKLVSLWSARADEKGIDLILNVAPDAPKFLQFDPVRVRQCVSNLVSNAIKFTFEGHVEINVSAEPVSDHETKITISIRDTGDGISPDALSRLFSAYEQEKRDTSRRHGGTGLGLKISQNLARLMNGDVVAESKIGEGSVFTFSFISKNSKVSETRQPADIANGDAKPQSTATLKGARILLVDDNDVNRKVAKAFLTPHKVTIIEAINGFDALKKLAQHEVDLVLLDIQMPVMDGIEALKRIRSSSEQWSAVPVIALTADAMDGDRQKYIAMGSNGYVSKPIDPKSLIAESLRMLSLAQEKDRLQEAG